MCGIAGIATQDAKLMNPIRNVEHALTQLRRRGPDGEGILHASKLDDEAKWDVYLGHTRLAINDLTDAARQPFESEDGRYVLVYNGEIYNFIELRNELSSLGFTFNSSGDTEVLLKSLIAWGPAVLPRLEGMFAFGFVDKGANTLLLARDAFGIKPLYWTVFDESIAFASEITALQTLTSRTYSVDYERACQYLLYGWHDFDSRTLLDGINSLEPGSYLTRSLLTGATNTRQWWAPRIEPTFEGSFEVATEKFRELLFESVKLHLRSDVPVGAALSGGMDSSTIIGVARAIDPNAEIHTFSYIDSDPRWSEESWVDLVSESFRTISHKVRLDDREPNREEILDAIRYQGEPFASSSILAQYKVFQEAHRVGIKVTLDGQGADEMLAGYHGFPQFRMRSLLEASAPIEAMRFARNWSKWPGRTLSGLLVSTFAEFMPGLRDNYGAMRLSSALGLTAKGGEEFISDSMPHIRAPRFDVHPSNKGRRLSEELRHALGGKRLGQLMRVADRNSMRWSVESRVPFLYKPLVEFCLSLPEDYLVSPDGETKSILRHAVRGIVPDQILDRRDKIGFKASNAAWAKALSQDGRLFKGLDKVSFVDSRKISSYEKTLLRGSAEFTDVTWRLFNLSQWVQE
jgi:asparagine synthase (glutamine-hydrolysing)